MKHKYQKQKHKRISKIENRKQKKETKEENKKNICTVPVRITNRDKLVPASGWLVWPRDPPNGPGSWHARDK